MLRIHPASNLLAKIQLAVLLIVEGIHIALAQGIFGGDSIQQLPRLKGAELAKVLLTMCENARKDSVRPVEIKATILGTNHAPSIYD